LSPRHARLTGPIPPRADVLKALILHTSCDGISLIKTMLK
jgi:hypothetical protein